MSETIAPEDKPLPQTTADWGLQSLPEGDLGYWRMGGLDLWARRRPREWRIAYRTGDDPTEAKMLWENLGSVGEDAVPEQLEVQRFAASTPGQLHFSPVLVDRSVVVRPENPLSIVADTDVEIFVSSPLWLSINDGHPGRSLLELGTLRLRPTWFGTPAEGERCYAVHTRARLDLASLQAHPLRCVTRLLLHNRGREHLRIERIKIPMLHLSLFATRTGGFCTQTVTVVRSDDDASIEVRFDDEPPEDAASRISPARLQEPGLLRALSAWLG